jgi:hypothetical protein
MMRRRLWLLMGDFAWYGGVLDEALGNVFLGWEMICRHRESVDEGVSLPLIDLLSI